MGFGVIVGRSKKATLFFVSPNFTAREIHCCVKSSIEATLEAAGTSAVFGLLEDNEIRKENSGNRGKKQSECVRRV